MKDFSVQSGKGRLVSVPGSDASVFLRDLKIALYARKLPSTNRRALSLPFSFAMFGENLSRSSGGGFSGKPVGGWTAIKLTFEDRDREGEVFLNLNPSLKKGEFSMKDPDFGDFVLEELAKVL
jgi:hypothetical protein